MLQMLDVPTILMDFTMDTDTNNDDVMIVDDNLGEPSDSLSLYCFDRDKETR